MYYYHRKAILAYYFFFYFILFLFFSFNNMLLSQYQPIFFNYNRDLSELFIIATGLPRWMIAHPWSFKIADTLIFTLPVLIIFCSLYAKRWLIYTGICFTFFLILYFLLGNVFLQYHLEPYVSYVLLSLLFITRDESKFYGILSLGRYYFLYIFFSAAIWKIARGSIFNPHEMSAILLTQHNDIVTGPCNTFNCRIYQYLIDHPLVSYLLFLSGTLLELFFVIGFFTKKFDRLLLVLAILFLAVDHLLMRIPYWAIMVSGITLLINTKNKTVKPLI